MIEIIGTITEILFYNLKSGRLFTIAKILTEDMKSVTVKYKGILFLGIKYKIVAEKIRVDNQYGEYEFLIKKKSSIGHSYKSSIIDALCNIKNVLYKKSEDYYEQLLNTYRDEEEIILEQINNRDEFFKNLKNIIKPQDNKITSKVLKNTKINPEVIFTFKSIGFHNRYLRRISEELIKKQRPLSEKFFLKEELDIWLDFSFIPLNVLDNYLELINVDPSDPLRIELHINFALSKALNYGTHTRTGWKRDKELNTPDIENMIISTLGHKIMNNTSDCTFEDIVSLVEKHINSMKKNKKLVAYKNIEEELTTPKIFQKEFNFLEMLLKEQVKKESNIDGFLSNYYISANNQLTDEQKLAVKNVFQYPISIITGGPGTGKTTIIKAITNYCEVLDKQCLLMAPTGKAADRITETCNRKAGTIHRFYYSLFKKDYQTDDIDVRLPYEVIVVDESSMIDIHVMDMVDYIADKNAHIVFVGDVDQLPPIGPGRPFFDTINYFKEIPITYLTQVIRFTDDNIPRIANMVKSHNPPSLKDFSGNISFQEFKDDREMVNHFSKLIYEKSKTDIGLEQFQIICPQNTSSIGTKIINNKIRESMGFLRKFEIGDKVIHIRNNYELDVMNGQTGYVIKVEYDYDKLISVDVKYKKDQIVTYADDEVQELDYAWAITVHKAQGSEYNEIIIPVSASNKFLWNSTPSLLYTAITRGKKVNLVGNFEFFQNVCENRNILNFKRNTLLSYLSEQQLIPTLKSKQISQDLILGLIQHGSSES